MKLLRIISIVVLFVVLLALWLRGPTPPASTQKPLLYPGAQHIVTQRIEGGVSNVQIATYDAAATSAVIGAFYKTELGNDGWEYLPDWSTPYHLDFEWVRGNRNTSVFGLQVALTDTEQLTMVDLQLSETIPH